MATLASDNFNRADGDSLGANWTEASGDIDIASNIADATAASRVIWAGTFSPANADYDVTADLRVAASVGGVGVMARYTDLNNFYYSIINTFSQTLTIRKRVASTNTTLGTYNGGQSTGVTYTVRFNLVGTALKAFQAGVERVSVTDGDLTSVGVPGMWTDSGDGTLDNFLVEGTAASGTVVKDMMGGFIPFAR